MPFRASMSTPPRVTPLVSKGLFPSTVRSWIVTLLAWTRMTVLLPAGREPLAPTPGPLKLGVITVTPWPAPANSSGLSITTFSAYVPARTSTVPPAATALMPSWMVAKASSPKISAGNGPSEPSGSQVLPNGVCAQLLSTYTVLNAVTWPWALDVSMLVRVESSSLSQT